MNLLQDGFLDEIIPGLKKKAERIRSAEGFDNIDDVELQLRFWFAQHYGIPMYSPVLAEYQIDQMLLEYYLCNWEPPAPPDPQKTTVQHKETLAEMIAKEFSAEDRKFMDDAFGKDGNFSMTEEDFK